MPPEIELRPIAGTLTDTDHSAALRRVNSREHLRDQGQQILQRVRAGNQRDDTKFFGYPLLAFNVLVHCKKDVK